MDDKANILIAIRPALYADLFSNEADQQLRELGDLTFQSSEDNLTSEQLARQIGGHDIVITGWGTPVFNDEVLAAADRLRLIVHSAGTIKRLLPPAAFANGRRITHAAAAMAVPVAETTLLLILLSLRQVHKSTALFARIRGRRRRPCPTEANWQASASELLAPGIRAVQSSAACRQWMRSCRYLIPI